MPMVTHAFYAKLKELSQEQLREVSAMTLCFTSGTTTGDPKDPMNWSYVPIDVPLPEWIYNNLPIMQFNSHEVLMNAKNFMQVEVEIPRPEDAIRVMVIQQELKMLTQGQLRELMVKLMMASSKQWKYEAVEPPAPLEMPEWIEQGMFSLCRDFCTVMRDSISLLKYIDAEQLRHPLAG